jgi:predicted molibdopterin-dependent oxidoreductase YjgC
MIKVYCDRCGKKLNTNDPHYYPLRDAANGDDIFFAISVYNKSIKRTYESRNDKAREVDDSPNFVYDYNAPDLCTECMRAINEAVKAVWDGKKPKTLGEIYGMVDDKKGDTK